MTKEEKLKFIATHIVNAALIPKIEAQKDFLAFLNEILDPTEEDQEKIKKEKDNLTMFSSSGYLEGLISIVVEEYSVLDEEEVDTFIKQVKLEKAMAGPTKNISVRCQAYHTSAVQPAISQAIN